MSRLALTLVLFGAVAQATPSAAATFLFIRHAESLTNAGTADPDELVDPTLTALGQQQALDLADRLAGIDLTTIYVSSYRRTSLTIAPTAAEFGLTPTVVPAIREWSFGDEPLTGIGDISAQIGALFGAWASGDLEAELPGRPTSESLAELAARVVPAYGEIVERHKDEDGVVAIVGHGGSIGWTLPLFAENVTLPFAFANNLRNTGIVQVEVIAGRVLVTDWQGVPFDANGPVTAPAPVPLPASGLLLLAALGGVAGVARRRGAAAA